MVRTYYLFTVIDGKIISVDVSNVQFVTCSISEPISWAQARHDVSPPQVHVLDSLCCCVNGWYLIQVHKPNMYMTHCQVQHCVLSIVFGCTKKV